MAVLLRETLATQVAARIAAQIIEEGLGPGDTLLPELQQAAQFNVSRATIREALRVLQAKGVIDVVNGQGAIVRPITSVPLSGYFRWAAQLRQGVDDELMEIRRGIEVQCALLAAQRRTESDTASMREIIGEMRAHLDDPETYRELNYQLHLAIAVATHNTMIHHLLVSLREPFKETTRHRSRYKDADTAEIQQSHEQIVAAIERGDAETAAREMAQHIDRGTARRLAYSRTGADGGEGSAR
ncbi:MAG TPA: FadR/GntR family transcriptional regulator [Thermomicrobiales bacterium]|nr:FadR/GntR family transcriptional regulator [Thermomicrobiales bacterium]